LSLLGLLLLAQVAHAIGPQLEQSDLGADRYRSYSTLCRELASALTARDGELINSYLDRDTFKRRVFTGLELSKTRMQALHKRIDSIIQRLGAVMVSQFPEQTQVDFLRLHRADENSAPGVQCLLRIDLDDEGLTYWSVRLAEHEGQIRVEDWYNHSLAQDGSWALRYANKLLLSNDPRWLEETYGNTIFYGITRKLVANYMAAIEKRDVAKIEKIYTLLPPELQSNSFILLLRMIAVGSDEKAYRRALDDIHRHLQGQQCYSLVLVDYYFYREEYAAAHTEIDRFAELIGGDAALDAMHANLTLLSGDYQAGIDYSRRAIENDPNHEGTYTTLYELLIKMERFDDAVAVLVLLEQRFGYQFDPDELVKDAAYHAFAKSGPFLDWRKVR